MYCALTPPPAAAPHERERERSERAGGPHLLVQLAPGPTQADGQRAHHHRPAERTDPTAEGRRAAGGGGGGGG
eukprot:2147731-Prymnesium_polylepis.1